MMIVPQMRVARNACVRSTWFSTYMQVGLTNGEDFASRVMLKQPAVGVVAYQVPEADEI